MRFIVIIFLFHLMIVTMPSTNAFADVAEASTGRPTDYFQRYDMADLSSEERQWFVKFLEGTFFADGWHEISNNILVKLPVHERSVKQQKLNELGNKIGREWCRDNDTRKIDTGMLKKWGHLLKSTAKDEPHLLATVIEHIDGEVESIID